MQDLNTNVKMKMEIVVEHFWTQITFEVFYNMDLDEDDYLSVCYVSAAAAECPKSDTYDLAVKYASDNALWLANYSAAYDVMTAKTVSTLKEID